MTFAILLPTVALCAALLGYAWFIEPNWVRVRRREVRVVGWPKRLDGLTILHISDLHIAHRSTPSRNHVRRAGQIPADFYVITGDFLSAGHGLDEACALMREFSQGKRVYAVPGNHEHKEYRLSIPVPGKFRGSRIDSGKNIQRLQAAGVTFLVNRHVVIEYNGERFVLAGVDDLYESKPDREAAMAGVPKGVPVVLLSHAPDIFQEAAASGVALMLAGHAHDGQVRIPMIGVPFTGTDLPLKPASGLHHRVAAVMHVSPGLGTSMIPMRFFARPEITVLEIRSL